MILKTLVTGYDLNLWANRQESRYRLPLLIRRLVHATVERIHHIGFPAEEGVQLEGWDGVVNVENGNAFVPDGHSVWELSVNQNIKEKADADYEKRRDNPLDLDPAATVFVFVTPRQWGGKDKWVKKRHSEGVWREVRAYDANDLELWLELAPAVHLWFSIWLNKHPETAEDITNFWTDWSEVTKPLLKPSLLTAGRDKIVNQVCNWLNETPSTLALKADTREEAVVFLAAILHQLPIEEQLQHLSRAVVVKESNTWNQLCALETPLLLIPIFNERSAITRASRHGHHVFLPLGRDSSDSQTIVTLPRLQVQHAQQALCDTGFSERRARELAPLARRSLMALRRKLAITPEVQQPLWAKPEMASALLPALLAGQWSDDKKHGDRNAISRLANTSYEKVRYSLLRWANESDPPIRYINDVWFLVSKEDAWTLLARYLTRTDLERFEEIVLDILGEIDPGLDIPANQRWAAGLYGKSFTYSSHIREGVADTLAIMGARSENTKWADIASAQERTNHIIRKLFSKAIDNWRLWASLSSQLSRLAEAAPSEFLKAVERALSAAQPVLVNLFEDSENGIFTRSSHPELLRSLELLAWNPDYLSRAALLLASLARIDPGGGLSNRPDNSLRNIFLSWLPHTTASLDQRLRVIDMLRDRESLVAWRLMSLLLPEAHPFGESTELPRWREWVPDPHLTVTWEELLIAVREIVNRMIEDVGYDGQRWKILIEHLGYVPKEQHEAIVEHLLAVSSGALTSEARLIVWSSLRTMIARHRRFPDAGWAMPREMVDRLQQLYEIFEPSDLIIKNAWLFSRHPELIGSFGRDWRARDQALAEARHTAVGTIYKHGGLLLILKLADAVEQPSELGFVLGNSNLLLDTEEDTLLNRIFGTSYTTQGYLISLANGFVKGRLKMQGWEWVENKVASLMFHQWLPDKQA